MAREPVHPNLHVPALLVIFVFSVLGCCVRPSPHRWLFFIPLIPPTFLLIFFVKTDDPVIDYVQGTWVAVNLFMMSDFVLLTDVQTTLRKKGQHVSSIAGASLLKRLQWGLDLYTSLRGVGWEHEPTTYLPPRRRVPRRESPCRRLWFVFLQVLALGQCAVMLGAGHLAMEINSSFRKTGPGFGEQVWWLRPTVLGHLAGSRAYIEGAHIGVSILAVFSGVSSTDAWPPLFGSFLDAYSVRDAWGRVWHQMMRRYLISHSNFAANLVNPSSKTSRTFLKLYTAFFLSSVIHYLGDVALLGNWSGGSLKFFALQPFAITFEHLVCALVRISGIRISKWLARIVGYAWVVLWFTITVPIWIEPAIRAGLVLNGLGLPIIIETGQKLKMLLGIET